MSEARDELIQQAISVRIEAASSLRQADRATLPDSETLRRYAAELDVKAKELDRRAAEMADGGDQAPPNSN